MMKKSIGKRFIDTLAVALIVAAFCVAFISIAGCKAYAASPCTYLDYDSDGKATTKTITEYTEITSNTHKLTNGWYVVSSYVTLGSRLEVTGNNVRVIIKDGATLNAPMGIHHAGDDVLFIYGQKNGTGKLIARGTTGCAGIGGNSKERGGTLNVHGFRVEAYGGQNAAGIGGGSGGAAGAFYSYAGSTYAEGGAGSDNGLIGGGAGIGGGYAGGGGYHQIYGGDVEAHGGRYAAGIGAGHWGKEGQLYIKNADVKAYGGFDAAGIGTGYNGGEGFYMFSMSGGTLYAEGQGGAAGIGGGPGSAGIRDTNISGGKITAVAGSTGTVAFGHGNEIFGNLNTGDGSMELQADMMVKAGSSASNAKVVKTNKTADKVSACHSNKYAEITKCSHPSKSYTNIGNDTSHQWDCTICGRIGTENHRQGSGNKCVCGADFSGIWVIKDGFYLIYNENHWNKMCDMVDNNQCGQRKFKLMNDISVSRPAGRNAKIQQQNTSFELTKHCFNGTFDGGGHTLEFNYTGTTPSGYVAPFVVARNATIMNLHVTGTIHNTGTGDGGVGGLIGLSSMYGSTITNVRISSTLRYDGKGSHVGGFIAGHFAENSGWVDEYKGCVFDGKIYSESSVMAGFHAKDVKAQMTDCLFIPSKLGNHSDNSRTFSIGGAKSLTNCFYTTRIGNFQESGSKQVYSVKSATPGISISYVGSPTVKYNAGLYTRYGSIIDYNGTCYASQGTSVTLKLTFSKPEYADHLRLNGSAAGIRNNGNGTYTFTMPAKDTVIDVEPPLEVRFLNDDGSVFHSAEVFAGGSLSANDYPSSDPVKASDGDNVKYTFAGWEYKGGDIPDVIRESIDITPVFTASYRVNFIRDDGSLIDRAFYPEGTRVSEIEFPADPTKDPTKDAEGHYSYVFDHWDKSTEVVTAETNYTAHFNTNMSEHNWTFSLDWSSDYNWLTAKATCCVDTKHPHSESERVEGHREAVWDDGANPCVDRGKWKYYVTYDDFSAGGVFYNSILYPEFYTAQYSFKYNVDPLGHDWIVEDGTDEDGWSVWATDVIIHEERRCRRCGTVEEREYTSDHIHGQSLLGFSMEIPPTCTMNGKYEYVVCSCGAPIREEDGRWIEISDKDLIIPATGHSQKAAVKEKEKQPTCTSPGSYEDVVYCKVCDEALSSEYVTTEPLGHDWGEPKYDRDWENGKVSAKRTCSRDADHIETETVQAIEHIDKEPTCEEKGSKYYDAEFTNEAFEMQKSEDVELDELGHDWDDGEITQESSCTEEGIRTFTCSRCDEKKTSKIPKSDHETFAVTDETSNTATCTEAGTMKQHEICALCGETITTTEIDTEPLGHLFWDLTYEWADDMSTVTAKHVCARDGCNETESETVKPTSIVLKKNSCETEGLIRYHAEFRNEAFEPQEIETKTEALGHDWGEWKETKAPTCSAAGEKERVCNNDSSHKETASVAIDPDAHDWGEWIVTHEATETEAGEKIRICKNNTRSHIEMREIPVLGHEHKLTKVDAADATCTEDGNTEYWICDQGANACGGYFADKNGKKEIDKEDTVIKATGHKPASAVKENEVAATCEKDGSYDEVVYCTVCREELSRETKTVTALGHDWGEWKETKAATETAEGEETRTCKSDPSHKETRVIPTGLSYRNVSGDGNVWYKGSNETSDFTFKRSLNDASTITHFTGISVDDNDVDPSCYTKESGSVIIKLKPEYLETLEAGEHTLTARFDDWDGDASAEFAIAEQEAQGEKDGDAGKDSDTGKDDDAVTNGNDQRTSDSVRTGDETQIVLWEMFFGESLLLIILLLLRRRALRR